MLTIAVAVIGLQIKQAPSDVAKGIMATTYGLPRPIRFISHVTENSGQDHTQASVIETVFRSPRSFKIDSTTIAFGDQRTQRSRSVMWIEGETIRVWSRTEGEKSILGKLDAASLQGGINQISVQHGSPLPTLFHRMLFGDYFWINHEYQVNNQSITLVPQGRLPRSTVQINFSQPRFPITERLSVHPMNRAGTDGWFVNTMHTVAIPPLDWDKALEFTPPKE